MSDGTVDHYMYPKPSKKSISFEYLCFVEVSCSNFREENKEENLFSRVGEKKIKFELVLKMDNQLFVYIGVILETLVDCIFKSHQQIGMKFNKNVSVDHTKENISAKIVQLCGRKMSRLIYEFPISSNPIKFTEMTYVDDKDMETMIALYCLTKNVNVKPVQLLVELADVKFVLKVTPLSQPYGVEDLCIEVLRTFVDRRLSIHEFDFDLSVG